MRALVLLALAAAARAQSCTNCDSNGCAPGTSSCPSECAIKTTTLSGCECDGCRAEADTMDFSEVDGGWDYWKWILANTSFTGAILLSCIFCCWPCILMGITAVTCLSSNQAQKREPKSVAWLFSCTVFCLAFFFTWITISPLSIPIWFVFGIVMIIPFMMEGCYDQHQMTVVTQQTTVVQQVVPQQPAININMAQQPAQPIIMTSSQAATMQQQHMAMAQPAYAQPQPQPGVIDQSVPAYAQQQQPVVAAAQPVAVTAQAQPVAAVENPLASAPVMAAAVQPLPEPEGKGAGGPGATSLAEFLAAANLGQYLQALQAFGASSVADLQDVSEEDLVQLGLKTLEVKRLLRSIAEATSSG